MVTASQQQTEQAQQPGEDGQQEAQHHQPDVDPVVGDNQGDVATGENQDAVGNQTSAEAGQEPERQPEEPEQQPDDAQRQAAEAQRVEQERKAREADEKRRQEEASAASSQPQEAAEANEAEEKQGGPLTPIEDLDMGEVFAAGALGAANVFGDEPDDDDLEVAVGVDDDGQEAVVGPEEEGENGGLFTPIQDGQEVAIGFSEGISGIVPVPVAVDNVEVAGHVEVAEILDDGGHDAGDQPVHRQEDKSRLHLPPEDGEVQEAAKKMGQRSGQVRRSRPKQVRPKPELHLPKERAAKARPPRGFNPPRLPGQRR